MPNIALNLLCVSFAATRRDLDAHRRKKKLIRQKINKHNVKCIRTEKSNTVVTIKVSNKEIIAIATTAITVAIKNPGISTFLFHSNILYFISILLCAVRSSAVIAQGICSLQTPVIYNCHIYYPAWLAVLSCSTDLLKAASSKLVINIYSL